LTELEDLLTDSGRFVEGNWIVYLLKLDDLLTETGHYIEDAGRSIDGSWMFF